MTRSIKSLACVLAMTLGSSAAAQFLDLDPTPATPDLGTQSLRLEIAEQMRRRIEQLESRSENDRLEQTIMDTEITLRTVIFDLLAMGTSQDSPGSPATLAGFRLTAQLKQLLSVIESMIADDGSSEEELDRNHLLNAVDRFNSIAVDAIKRTNLQNAKQLDAGLAAAFAPLIPFAEALDDGSIVSHWPIVQKKQMLPGASDSIESLQNALLELKLSTRAKENLDEIVGSLHRGLQFIELREEIRNITVLLAQAVQLASSLNDYQFLAQQDRDLLVLMIENSISGLQTDHEQRTASIMTLRFLGSVGELVDTMNMLVIEDKGGRIDERMLRDTIHGVVSLNEQLIHSEKVIMHIERIDELLQNAITFRHFDERDSIRSLRTILRQLARAYLMSERKLMEQLPDLAANPDMMVSPAQASLVQSERRQLRDLTALVQGEDWMLQFERIAPGTSNGIKTQLLKIGRWLLDNNRRPAARDALEMLQKQLEIFQELPLESELQQGNGMLIEITGGRQQELADEIRLRRQDWARAWALGIAGGREAEMMFQLHRLLGNMQALVEVLQADNATDLALLNRWGAWYTSTEALAPAQRDLIARMKLATFDALGGKYDQLQESLDSFEEEAPLIRLVGMLLTRLKNPLEQVPDGIPGLIGSLVIAPEQSSYATANREQLASLCTYCAELKHARNMKRKEFIPELEKCIANIADEIHDALAPGNLYIHAIPGFDGDEPIDDDAGMMN